MDSDGMPLVGAGVDYEKLAAIEQKRTVAFINHFIMQTARFLNRFSNTCEEKLTVIAERIDRLDTVLKNLESKLNSVPGLENIEGPVSEATTPATTPTTTVVVQDTPNKPEPEPEPEMQPDSNSSAMPVCKDPRFEKYFKMLNMGVPSPAVQNKMRMEGVDPALLNDPNAPAPSGGKQDSDDAFSDSSDGFSD